MGNYDDDYECRKVEKKPSVVLKNELNTAQRSTLYEMLKFGWELKFVRHPLHDAIPVVFDADRKRFAVIGADGRLNENPGFNIRH